MYNVHCIYMHYTFYVVYCSLYHAHLNECISIRLIWTNYPLPLPTATTPYLSLSLPLSISLCHSLSLSLSFSLCRSLSTSFIQKNVEGAEMLSSKGADVSAQGLLGVTPLHLSALLGYHQVGHMPYTEIIRKMYVKFHYNMTMLPLPACRTKSQLNNCI